MIDRVSKQEALDALELISYTSPHESQQSIVRKKIYAEIIERFINQQDDDD